MFVQLFSDCDALRMCAVVRKNVFPANFVIMHAVYLVVAVVCQCIQQKRK